MARCRSRYRCDTHHAPSGADASFLKLFFQFSFGVRLVITALDEIAYNGMESRRFCSHVAEQEALRRREKPKEA